MPKLDRFMIIAIIIRTDHEQHEQKSMTISTIVVFLGN